MLTPNANGQHDWNVDWCFPTSVKPCDNTGTARWSTTTTAASGDTNAANPSFSVFRSASSQPPTDKVSTTLTPGDALTIYYNAQGWVNTGVQPFLRQLRFDADASFNSDPAMPVVRPVAIAINLSGMAERCEFEGLLAMNVRTRQNGVALIELMIAMVILAIGLLGAVGLQARSLSALSNAGARVDATIEAERLIGLMWTDQANLASYNWDSTGGTAASRESRAR